MAFACLASLAIFAGGLVALSILSWYKGSGPQEKKRVRSVVVQDSKEEALAEQLA